MVVLTLLDYEGLHMSTICGACLCLPITQACNNDAMPILNIVAALTNSYSTVSTMHIFISFLLTGSEFFRTLCYVVLLVIMLGCGLTTELLNLVSIFCLCR